MFWILISAAVFATYWFLVRPHSYWKRRGVVQSKPMFLLGDTWPIVFRKRAPPEMVEQMYNYVPDARYIGIYQFLTPNLLVKDPELLKQIMVKDFESFLDHRGFVQAEADPLFGRNLFSLKGQEWREMRATLSPSFTSSKMRYMFSLMSQNGDKLVRHFWDQKDDVITIEMKDVAMRFANDVIANIAFGFECDSLKEPKNEFYLKGKEASDFTSLRKILVFMGYIAIPKILKFFNVTLFSQAMTKYFMRIISENIESRERHNVRRPDMMTLLLDARKNNPKQEESAPVTDAGFATVEEFDFGKNQKVRKTAITYEDIASQAFIFFFAGFDTVSTAMCFMAYELAVNSKIQEKLRREVDETKEKCKKNLTYDALTSMKYMDMVVSETLRKWPNSIATDRVCTRPLTIEPKFPNETAVRLEEGVQIMIPIYALHRDPKYYPEPERFNPERFSDENKHKIVPYTFMPFGTGPRSCIGSRFALLEIKIMFYYILAKFEIVPVEKTQIPIRFNRKAINMTTEKGHWLGLRRRED